MSGFYAQVVGILLNALSLCVACYVVWLFCQINTLARQDSYAQTSRDQWQIRAKQDAYVIKHEMGLVGVIFLLIFGIDLTIIGRNEYVDLASFTIDNIVMVIIMFILALVGIAWVHPRQLDRCRSVTVFFLSIGAVSALWSFIATALLLQGDTTLRNQLGWVLLVTFCTFFAIFIARCIAHTYRNEARKN